MSENPIMTVRRQEGLTQAEMALLGGVSIGYVSFVERGGAIRSFGKLEEVLGDLGYDVGKVWEVYQQWRNEQRKALRRRYGMLLENDVPTGVSTVDSGVDNTTEKRERALELLEAGKTVRAVAEEVGMSKSWVSKLKQAARQANGQDVREGLPF